MRQIAIILMISILIAVAIIARIFRAADTKDEKKKSRRRKGKRCPSCKTVIDKKRKVCQHCGYEFK